MVAERIEKGATLKNVKVVFIVLAIRVLGVDLLSRKGF